MRSAVLGRRRKAAPSDMRIVASGKPIAMTQPKSVAHDGLSPIRRLGTLADEVADRIIMAIVRGEKAPGERVTEAEIAQAMNVSRVPAREAMQKLQLRGILVSEDVRGLRVADFSEERIAELYEVRLSIEKILFRHALPRCRRHPKLIDRLEAIVDRMEAASNAHDVVATSLLDVEFHGCVAEISGNELAARVWEGLKPHLIIIFCREWSRAPNQPGEVKLHRDLCELLRTGSIRDIDATLSDHILNSQSLLSWKWRPKR
jgi:GntR family transcriptional regulator, rspAB operon transcriptional repressor